MVPRVIPIIKAPQVASPPAVAASSRSWIVIVSIASEMRPAYWRAQNATWGHQLGLFMPVTERDVQPCQVCLHASDNLLRAKQKLGDGTRGTSKYTDEYMCAQKRPLQAIRHALLRHPKAGWYLVVDDDTWVDSVAMRELLRRLDGWKKAKRPVVVGSVFANDALKYVSNATNARMRSSVMVLGGAGYALNGPWCWWNSDWALSECLGMAGMKPTHHPGFTQWTYQCNERAITCHYVDGDQQQNMTMRHASAPGVQGPAGSNTSAWSSALVTGTKGEYHHSFRWEWVEALTVANGFEWRGDGATQRAKKRAETGSRNQRNPPRRGGAR